MASRRSKRWKVATSVLALLKVHRGHDASLSYLELHEYLLKLDTGIGGQQRLLIYELLSSPWCSSCHNASPRCSLFILLARIILMGSCACGCCWPEYEHTLLLLLQSMSIFTLGAVLAFGPMPGHHYYWALTLNTITLTKVCAEKITFSQTNIFNLALMLLTAGNFWKHRRQCLL